MANLELKVVVIWLRLSPMLTGDWQGGGNARSTSSGCDFVNAPLVHTSSRTQHVISLASTESEFYAATSGAIDTIYFKHITESQTIPFILTDNSASRQIACKLGTSRSRHVNGRLLWFVTTPSKWFKLAFVEFC